MTTVFKYDAPFIAPGATVEIEAENPGKVDTPYTSTVRDADGQDLETMFHQTLADAVKDVLYDIAWCCEATGEGRFSRLVQRAKALQNDPHNHLAVIDFKLAE